MPERRSRNSFDLWSGSPLDDDTMKIDLTDYEDLRIPERGPEGSGGPEHALELDVTPRNPNATEPALSSPGESQISGSLQAYGILVDGVNSLGKQWEDNYYCLGGNAAPLEDVVLDNRRGDILGRPVVHFQFTLRNFSRTPALRVVFHLRAGKLASKKSAVQFFFGSKLEASIPMQSSGGTITQEFYPIVPPGENRSYSVYIRLASDQSSDRDTLFFKKAELLVTNPQNGEEA